jgi:hypothetical protein
MLPVVIFVALAVPLVVLGFLATRRSRAAGEHRAGESDADRLRTQQEFEDAERYQEQWREEHKHDLDRL